MNKMGKITEEQIKEIKCLRAEGLSTYKIAKCLDVAQSTIYYHLMPSYKKRTIERCKKNFKCLPLWKQRKERKKYKEYQRLYHKNRYRNDPLFKEKQIAASINYKKKASALKVPSNS